MKLQVVQLSIEAFDKDVFPLIIIIRIILQDVVFRISKKQ